MFNNFSNFGTNGKLPYRLEDEPSALRGESIASRLAHERTKGDWTRSIQDEWHNLQMRKLGEAYSQGMHLSDVK